MDKIWKEWFLKSKSYCELKQSLEIPERSKTLKKISTKIISTFCRKRYDLWRCVLDAGFGRKLLKLKSTKIKLKMSRGWKKMD